MRTQTQFVSPSPGSLTANGPFARPRHRVKALGLVRDDPRARLILVSGVIT
jgi:hypothetical protein